MRLLLDTHALLWWWADSPRLSNAARHAMVDADCVVLVSVASAWEIAIKQRHNARRADGCGGQPVRVQEQHAMGEVTAA